MTGTAVWPYVVQYIGSRLAEPDQVRLANELRYGERVDKPSPTNLHRQFAEALFRSYELVGVVTTNYDLGREGASASIDQASPQTGVLLRGHHRTPTPRGIHVRGTAKVGRRHRNRAAVQASWITELVVVRVDRRSVRGLPPGHSFIRRHLHRCSRAGRGDPGCERRVE